MGWERAGQGSSTSWKGEVSLATCMKYLGTVHVYITELKHSKFVLCSVAYDIFSQYIEGVWLWFSWTLWFFGTLLLHGTEIMYFCTKNQEQLDGLVAACSSQSPGFNLWSSKISWKIGMCIDLRYILNKAVFSSDLITEMVAILQEKLTRLCGLGRPVNSTKTCLSWCFEEICIDGMYRVSKQYTDDRHQI